MLCILYWRKFLLLRKQKDEIKFNDDKTGSTMLHGLGVRLSPSRAVQALNPVQRCGACFSGGKRRGACWRGSPPRLRFVSCRPAVGRGRLSGGGRRWARWRTLIFALYGLPPRSRPTRTHLLTHRLRSFGLEPGPDSDRVTPKNLGPRSPRPSCTPNHILTSHLSTLSSLTPLSIANGDLSPLWG
jgi:hypothetical protein